MIWKTETCEMNYVNHHCKKRCLLLHIPTEFWLLNCPLQLKCKCRRMFLWWNQCWFCLMVSSLLTQKS